MKKKYVHRFLSLVCTLSLMLTLSIPAFAAKQKADDLALTSTESIYLADGTKVTFFAGPAILPLDLDIESGWARPNASFNLSCTPDKGNHADWDTYNIGQLSMEVTYTFTIPGEDPISMTKSVISGDHFGAYAESKSGNGLDMDVSISIKAKGTEANYSFSGRQFWA